MILLGLDISTSCTGYCVISSDDKKLIEAGGIELAHKKSLFEKAKLVKDKIKDINARHKIEIIAIEENLQSFRSGMSSAKTLQALAKFNGIVCYIAESTCGIEPRLINVISARSKLSIKINRKAKESTKEQVLSWVKQHPTFKSYEWPKKRLKRGPRANTIIDDPSCYDIADSAVVALSVIFEQSSDE